jgi:3-deoxy-7-phosphoheptulonate synthase
MAEARLRQESGGAVQAGNMNMELARYMPPPMDFKGAVPATDAAAATVEGCRESIRRILDGADDRLILIVGPCSIHDISQAVEYAGLLRGLQEKVGDRFLLLMRAYVEKGRSGTGWTGFLTDPRLDGSGDVQEGVIETRKLLNRLGEMGVPAAVEFINPLVPAYIGDLVSWAAIGARSSGSQIHRDMASGLPMPMGFKNGLDGGIEAAIGAVGSAGMGHDFLGLDDNGGIAAFRTRGNPHCHPVLRGGERPNYDAGSVGRALKELAGAGLRPKLMVDCSHGNSGKVAENQAGVFRNVMGQIAAGNRGIIGLMLESHLNPGRQDPGRELRHGVSVTDECLGWNDTEKLVLEGYRQLL